MALTLYRNDLGIQANAAATVSEINAYASYQLTGTGVNVSGHSRAVSSFNLQNDAWAATVSEDDARQRAILDLASAIYLQLSLWSQRQTAAAR